MLIISIIIIIILFSTYHIQVTKTMDMEMVIHLLAIIYRITHLEFFTKHSISTTDLIQYNNNNNLTTSTHVKFLGLIIDSTLSWNPHIDLVSKRLSTACYALNCLKHLVSRETLKIIYFSHLQSILSYGIIFWGSSPGA